MSGFQIENIKLERKLYEELRLHFCTIQEIKGHKKLLQTNLKLLMSSYKKAYSAINEQFRDQHVVTPTEVEFRTIFKEQFRLKYYQAFQIGPYVVDLFCPKLNLYVEIDGGIHNAVGKMNKDMQRLNQIMGGVGIIELRFTNEQVLFEKQYVVQILNALKVRSDYEANLILKKALIQSLKYLL